ncbi:MAG TPA: DUF3147 family protein [Terracidiphilus sp.]|jgi:urea transporter
MHNLPELAVRFLIGGAFVSFFAVVAEIFRPKSFAGLFGAAPSVALATLALTISERGKMYAAIETHFMIFGAIAFCCYAMVACWVLRRYKPPALTATLALLPIWFAVSFALWSIAR